ncbi:MAG: cytochrome b [Plesiomonas sp.]|uniref:cytochrome b n=1 Tax=Plesiomonas sp. TaxID=2486279 RepID=UPI003F2B19C0
MTVQYYDRLSRVLHWIMAAIIIYATFAGYAMHLVVDSKPHVFSFLSTLNISLATVGTVLFFVRWIWRFFRVSPGLKIDNIPKNQINIAKMAHSVIYFAMFMVFFSGFLMIKESYLFFWMIEVPNPISSVPINDFFFTVHRIACIFLALMVLLHVAAVVKHHLVLRNNVLLRMLGPRFTLR